MPSPTTTRQPNYVPSKAPFQIEDFYLTQLNIGYVPPGGAGQAATHYRSGFDYQIGVHNEEKNRYRVRLYVTIEEMTDDGTPIGRSVQTDICGYFAITPPDEPKEKMDRRALLNGISTLYGILRGIVASATGVFPGNRPLLLPCQMPEDIVDLVDSNRMKAQGGSADAPNPAKRGRGMTITSPI